MGRIKIPNKVKTRQSTAKSKMQEKMQRGCKAYLHEVFKDYTNSNRLYCLKKNNREISVADKNLLRSMNHISERSTYVCDGCFSWAKGKQSVQVVLPSLDNGNGNVTSPVLQKEAREVIEDNVEAGALVDELVSLISKNKISSGQLEKLAIALGRSQERQLWKDTEHRKGNYKNLEETLSLSTLFLM